MCSTRPRNAWPKCGAGRGSAGRRSRGTLSCCSVSFIRKSCCSNHIQRLKTCTAFALSCLVEEKRKSRLLVVDDERTIRKLLERIATRAGFDVDTARDGEEALQMLAVKDYDIAIVDLMMPRVSGYELVQYIASLKERPTVIVATALTNGDVASLDDSVVRRVIKKPFDITLVASALIDTAKQVAEQRAAK